MGRYESDKKRSKGGMRVLDILMVGITPVCGVLLLLAYLTRWVNPNTVSFLSIIGFVAPVLYVLNVVCALYWAVRWRGYFFIPVAVLLLGAGNISLFFRPSFSKPLPEAKQRKLRVMTFNAMGFIYDAGNGRVVSSIDGVAEFLKEHNPDILCLQEFQAKSAAQKADMDEAFGFDYNKHSYIKQNSVGGGWGLAVYSKHKIIDSGAIAYAGSNNSSMWADVVVGADTVRVINNHLQTTSINFLDREYISNQEFIHSSPDREERVRGIIGKLRRNNMLRAVQADSLALVVEAAPYDVVVCGDFNDTPMSYTYFTVRGELRDAFVEKGSGMASNTFKGLFNMFRIDYVLYSRNFTAVGYDTPENEYSDHKPVVADFALPLK